MLKISDYIYIMLSFFAILIFYLIFSGGLSINSGINEPLETVVIPENYSAEEEYRSEEPVLAVVCGNQADSERTQNVIKMAAALKIEYAVFSAAEQITERQAAKATTIVVTADSWEEIGNKDLLFDYAGQQGKNLVFAGIMEEQAGEYNKTIGVLKNEGTVKIEGVMLSEEMFIQGMVYYDDIDMEAADITTDARCKKLMTEKSKEQVEQRELVPLIWEKKYGKGCFYVVNGDFLTGGYGIGIFTGILSQMEDTFVYPVINAKANLLDSFPELDNSYESRIEELYNRDTNMFVRDIVWPSLVKLGESNNLVFSMRLNRPVGEEQKDNYEYLAGLIQRRYYEIDDSFKEQEPELPYICSGHKQSEKEVFKMQSSISGAGLATHCLDMSEVMGKNADNSEYEWSGYSLELSKLMHSLYQDTQWVDAMTVSQASERYKRYLLLRPVIEKSGQEITIKTENFHDLCFYMMRTEKTVLSGDGYEVTKAGEDAYLIKVLKDNISIQLRDDTENAQKEVQD